VTPPERATSIEAGLRGVLEFEVDEGLLTDVGGSLGDPVLSTPGIGVGTHQRRVIDVRGS
jgi:hypothetical protein